MYFFYFFKKIEKYLNSINKEQEESLRSEFFIEIISEA
tara:strand:+ start:30 stop:143 length:114 start_codon:yes stop_codon:yes gene_type:complete